MKMTTSIQYQVTNFRLFREVFTNWKNFNSILNEGPEKMKAFLFTLWNEEKDKLKNRLEDNKNLKVRDMDKVVSIDDFNITYNETSSKIPIFFVTFPDYDGTDAASKYVAVALAPMMPRYFTLEYSENFITHTPTWVVGEFYVGENGRRAHKNYGNVDNMRITYFAGIVMNMLEGINK